MQGDCVVTKHFVRNDGDIATRAQGREIVKLVPADEVAGRIIRIHYNNGSRPIGQRLFDGVEVDTPCVVIVKKTVVAEDDGLESSKIVEQRIGWPGRDSSPGLQRSLKSQE